MEEKQEEVVNNGNRCGREMRGIAKCISEYRKVKGDMIQIRWWKRKRKMKKRTNR